MGKVGWEKELCGGTAMAGQHREGALGATVVLCCGERALCTCVLVRETAGEKGHTKKSDS